MNRKEFQELATIRLKDAEHLLAGGCYDGAYYLAGYVIECALKACIARQTKREEFPPPRKIVDGCYTHDLLTLVKTAGLEAELDSEKPKDGAFTVNWSVATRWKEDCRYQKRSEVQARELLAAIVDKKHGVLRWVKHYW